MLLYLTLLENIFDGAVFNPGGKYILWSCIYPCWKIYLMELYLTLEENIFDGAVFNPGGKYL
jgi:hypothetical protein